MNNQIPRKLLFISYYLPPTKTVAAVRLFHFHQEVTKYFQEVHCLTTSNRDLFPKEESFHLDDKNITEIKTWDLRRLLNRKNNISTGLSPTARANRLARFISRVSYSFPFNLLLADGGLTYIFGGYFKGKKLIQQHDIKVLFSSYKPYSDHLICFLLKKWNPELTWIADFRDLHADEIRKNVFFPKLQKWFSRIILKKADIVTTVSNGLAKHIQECHHNVYVLRNGISAQPIKKSPDHFYKKFTIAYTGSIYPPLQDAELLFKALAQLIEKNKIDKSKIQLIYAGKEGSIWDSWVKEFKMEDVSTTHGFLPIEQANQIQQQSHINLLLSWSNENLQGILTAKFYEYLLAQNPILLIITGARDKEFEGIFQKLKIGQVTYNNDDHLRHVEEFILEKYQKWERGESLVSIPKDALEEFRWDNQMKLFLEKNNLL